MYVLCGEIVWREFALLMHDFVFTIPTLAHNMLWVTAVSRIALSLTILVLYSWRSPAMLCLLFRRNFLHKSRPHVWEKQITSFQCTCWSIILGTVFFLTVEKSVKLVQTQAGTYTNLCGD